MQKKDAKGGRRSVGARLPASAASLSWALLAWAGSDAPLVASDPPLVIAHRGASGYLPEHTLAAKALAHGLGADFLEQDVVLSRDRVPLVLHDIHLDAVTDVASVFPQRAREDGRFYAADFTLEEIRRLEVRERVDLKTGQPVYPGRFPPGASRFHISTLAEELELIAGLNKTTGRAVGVYTEIKQPQFHRELGMDISKIVLDVLREHGYREPDDRALVQCFDERETRRLRSDLGCRLRIVRLLGNSDWSKPAGYLRRDEVDQRLKEIAEYADGIGPPIEQLIPGVDERGRPEFGPMVESAHRLGLVVHPYTARADSLPSCARTLPDLIKLLFGELGVDGVFTDFPDVAVRTRAQMGLAAGP